MALHVAIPAWVRSCPKTIHLRSCPKVAIWEAGGVQEKRRDALDLLQERVKEIYSGSLGRKVNRKSEKSKKRCLLRNRRSWSWRGAWTKGGRSLERSRGHNRCPDIRD